MPSPVYKRILLKLSGEALMGNQGFGVDPQMAVKVAEELKEVHSLGVEMAIVIGGGNISGTHARAARAIAGGRL